MQPVTVTCNRTRRLIPATGESEQRTPARTDTAWQKSPGRQPRVSALFRQHRCTAAYLDVGTNIGVQLRKLFEPHRFEGAPVLPVFSAAFGEDRCRVCAVGIEPNPRHARRLDVLESKLTAAGFGVLVLRGAATTEMSTVQLALPAKGWNEGIDLDARLGGLEAPQQRNAFAARGAELVNVTGFDLAAVIRHVHAQLPAPRPRWLRRPRNGAGWLL